MSFVPILAWLLALPPLFALTYFTFEVLVGLKPLPPLQEETTAPRIAVLIPAHNEASGIAATIARVRRGAPEDTRILVVADNCSDETASRAREAGADVAERNDASCRGKGYALAFGRERLSANPPEVVVVLDADCVFASGGLAPLASAAVPPPASRLPGPGAGASRRGQPKSAATAVRRRSARPLRLMRAPSRRSRRRR